MHSMVGGLLFFVVCECMFVFVGIYIFIMIIINYGTVFRNWTYILPYLYSFLYLGRPHIYSRLNEY
jgi:hypothetical protein